MIVKCAIELPTNAPQAPREFRIWRAGANPTDKGVHILTPKSVETLLAAQEIRGNLVSIDVDHLSLNDTSPPEARKAVGWHRLAARLDANGAPELWAVDVQWTDVARGGLEKSPPEWRYFSPAYDVDKSGEIVRYLNTALTNNPATWAVSALANQTSTEEEPMKKMSEVLAALKAMAESGDEEEKKQAASMLAAFGDEGDEKEEKPEEKAAEDKPEEKASEDKPEEKASEDKPEETASVVASLVGLVQNLTTKVDGLVKKDENAERETLLASRKDFSPELVAVLRKAPMSTLREAVTKVKPLAKKDPAAAERVTATLGAGQGGAPVSRLSEVEAADLDRRMGITPVRASIRREGNSLVLGALPADEAKALLAAKSKESAK